MLAVGAGLDDDREVRLDAVLMTSGMKVRDQHGAMRRVVLFLSLFLSVITDSNPRPSG